jgi:hypothetical protein
VGTPSHEQSGPEPRGQSGSPQETAPGPAAGSFLPPAAEMTAAPPGMPAAAVPETALPPAPPPRAVAWAKANPGPVVVLGITVLALLAVLLHVMMTAPPRTLTLPASAAGYTRLTGSMAQQAVISARQAAEQSTSAVSPRWSKAYAAARIGFYRKPGALSPLIFLGFARGASPAVDAALGSGPPAAGLPSFFRGAGIRSWRRFPPGPLGGVLGCGMANSAAVPTAVCVWADSSVVAMVGQAGMTSSQLAQVALAFRNAAEQ